MSSLINPLTGVALDPARDCCPISEWTDGHCMYAAALHPGGFLVFVPPAEIEHLDEYADGDPYGVEENLEGYFHSQRTAMTVSAVQQIERVPGKVLRILDVGCGEGHITRRLSTHVPLADVLGVDGSVTAIGRGKDRYPDLALHVADAHRLPFADATFDLVVLNNLWEHVPDPLRMLSEVSRVTEAGGHVLISTPSRYRLANLVRAITGKGVELISEHHVTEYTVGQVLEQLRYGGYGQTRVLTERFRMSLKANLARIPFQSWARATRSHHSLEPTVFYLAQKLPKDRPPTLLGPATMDPVSPDRT